MKYDFIFEEELAALSSAGIPILRIVLILAAVALIFCLIRKLFRVAIVVGCTALLLFGVSKLPAVINQDSAIDSAGFSESIESAENSQDILLDEDSEEIPSETFLPIDISDLADKAKQALKIGLEEAAEGIEKLQEKLGDTTESEP